MLHHYSSNLRSTIKLDKSIDEKVQEHADRYDEYLPWVQRGLTLHGREKEWGCFEPIPVTVKKGF